jgi:endonuclease/exonuclease/phosphatase family metal-dependent hydrolase
MIGESPITNLQLTLFRPSRFGLITLLLAALAAPGCTAGKRVAAPPPRADQVVMVVVTWNVHAGRADLPRFIDDLTQGRITGTPVRDYTVLLQETIAGNRYDAVKVAREHQLWAYFQQVRESRQGTSGNAILSTAMPITARTIVLPHIRRMRKAILATFEIDGQPLFIIDTHLENRISWLKGGLFSDRAREEQAHALLRDVPPGFGILGGDFNTWLGSEEGALQALGRRFNRPADDVDVPTFANRLPLDHLFFDLPPHWSAFRRVLDDRYGSDHHPVIGTIVRGSAS